MKDIKRYLSRAAFCIFGLKVLILGANWPLALGFGIASCVFLVTEYFEYKKGELARLEAKLAAFEQLTTDLQTKVNYLSDSVGSLQVSRGYQKIANLNK